MNKNEAANENKAATESIRKERVQLLVRRVLAAVDDNDLDLLSCAIDFDELKEYLRQMVDEDALMLFDECRKELAGGQRSGFEEPLMNRNGDPAWFNYVGNALKAIYELPLNESMLEELGKIVKAEFDNALEERNEKWILEFYFRCLGDERWYMSAVIGHLHHNVLLPEWRADREKGEAVLSVILEKALEEKDNAVLRSLARARREELLSRVRAGTKTGVLYMFYSTFDSGEGSPWWDAARHDPAYIAWSEEANEKQSAA
jgi:hypothetical protein